MLVLKKIKDNTTEAIPLSGRVLYLGKHRENDIVIDDERIADIVAKLCFEDGVYTIIALKSGSVRINGKKCNSSICSLGDRIEIGKTVFVFDNSNSDEAKKTEIGFSKKAENLFNRFAHFTEMVGRERDLNKLLSTIMEILLETIGGNDAFIFKINAEGKPELFVSSDNSTLEDRFSDTIVQQTILQKKGVCIPNALSDPKYGNARSIADLRLSSVLCSPIMVASRMLGIIYLGTKNDRKSFTNSDLTVLSTYAVIAGTLINHAEYMNQQRKTIRKLTQGDTIKYGIIAESKIMHGIIEAINSIADSDIGILLEGETGTGKDVFAKFIHSKSKRSEKSMVVVNCSSIQKDLLESELFGHVKGSFTGAVTDHKGLFLAAENGTLFLDEIGDMDFTLQSKFLRTLETGKIRSVGSLKEKDVNVRIICATNKNLSDMVDKGTFRQDLFFRINQFRFEIPPLRDREDDVIHLAYFFLEKYKAEYPGRAIVDFHPDSLKFIKSYNWPGNIRELVSTVHKTVISSNGPLGKIEIPVQIINKQYYNFEEATKDFQKNLIKKALKVTGGNKEHAAKLTGLGRSTFFRYISSMEIG